MSALINDPLSVVISRSSTSVVFVVQSCGELAPELPRPRAASARPLWFQEWQSKEERGVAEGANDIEKDGECVTFCINLRSV